MCSVSGTSGTLFIAIGRKRFISSFLRLPEEILFKYDYCDDPVSKQYDIINLSYDKPIIIMC